VIGIVLGHLWTLLLLRQVGLAALCLMGFWAQTTYRVPGGLPVRLLPVVGLALVVLSGAMVASDLLRSAAKDNPYRRTFQAIKWGTTILVFVFVIFSAFVFLNGVLDRSPAAERRSDVVALEREELNVGWRLGYAWADLTSWAPSRGVARVLVWNTEQDQLWSGQAVIVRVHPGAWGIEWVERIERDEEKYNRRVLAASPTASQAWKNLVQFYLDRQRWADAMAAAREYLALYPNDRDFALDTAAAFGQVRRHADVVTLVEPFIKRRPTYMVYNVVGFALGHVGRKQEAVALLRKSIPLEPDNFWAYYHLGYVYASAGNAAEAVAMFEKVLALRPNFPEVQEQLRQLRSRVKAARP
jgi:tetratricopeptide (TPR) repeat protein